MNLADKFVVNNAAIESALIPKLDQRQWHGWGGFEGSAGESELAYVMEDHFGVQTVTAGVFGINAATAVHDDLQRICIFDAAGLIEQFSASNISAVLAQPACALNLPRHVFLKRSTELGVYRENNVRAYVVSDPFPALREQLAEFGRPDASGSLTVPAEIALKNAARVLDAAREECVLPSKILRGTTGVFFYFSNDARYAEIECDCDGDVGIVLSDRSGNPTLWFSKSNQFRSDLAKIRAFLV